MDEDDTHTEERTRLQGEVNSHIGKILIINIRELKSHPLKNIIGNLHEPLRTRSHFRIIEEINSLTLVSQLEPKNTETALNDKKDVDKFEAKSELKIFLGYSETSRAYRIFNLKYETIEESPHVIFNEKIDKSVNYRNKDNEAILENK